MTADPQRPFASRLAMAVTVAVATAAAWTMVRFGGQILAGDTGPALASVDFNAALFEDLLGPYWSTADALREGATAPSPQYLYPATLAVLLAPLTAMGGASLATGLAVALAALTVAAVCTAALLGSPARSARDAAGLGALVGSSFAVLHASYWANVGGLCVALALVGWTVSTRGRELRGGALVGVAAALKPTPALLILGLLVAGRKRAALGAFAAFFGLAAALPCAVMGLDGFFEFHRTALEQLASLRDFTTTPEGARGAQDLLSIGIRLGLGPLHLALGVAAFGIWWIQPRTLRDQGLWWLLLASAMARPTWAHGLAWLPVAWWTLRSARPGARRLMALSVLLGSTPATWLFPGPTEALRAGLPFLSMLLVAIALSIEAAPATGDARAARDSDTM